MKILVLGSNGQLGKCLHDQLLKTDHHVIFTSRDQIDISLFEETKTKIIELSPDIIINTAAYTAVDRAEENQCEADLINHLAVSNISEISNIINCWLIHISTDYVFDGKTNVPYLEDDLTNPQNIYGLSKLDGEKAIKSSGCKHIILRTSWVYSEYGNNFLKTMLDLGNIKNELRVVVDQIGYPTYAQDIARAILNVIDNLKSHENISGIYHFASELSCSWASFSSYIFAEAKKLNRIKNKPKITEVSSKEFVTLAKRPEYSLLNSTKLRNIFGIKPSDLFLGIKSSIVAIENTKQK